MFKKKERERDTEEKVSISSLGNLSLSLSHGQWANQVLSFSICLTNQIWQVDWSEQAANVRSLWGKNVSHYIFERNVHFRQFFISKDKPTAKCHLYSMTVIHIISLVWEYVLQNFTKTLDFFFNPPSAGVSCKVFPPTVLHSYNTCFSNWVSSADCSETLHNLVSASITALYK